MSKCLSRPETSWELPLEIWLWGAPQNDTRNKVRHSQSGTSSDLRTLSFGRIKTDRIRCRNKPMLHIQVQAVPNKRKAQDWKFVFHVIFCQSFRIACAYRAMRTQQQTDQADWLEGKEDRQSELWFVNIKNDRNFARAKKTSTQKSDLFKLGRLCVKRIFSYFLVCLMSRCCRVPHKDCFGRDFNLFAAEPKLWKLLL